MTQSIPRRSSARLKLTLLPVLLLIATPLLAQPDSECGSYFAGRSVRFVVAAGAGGGFDRSARALAREFAEISNARAQVANIPDGNGFLAVRAVSKANSNSLTLGLLSRERVISPLANNSGTTLDDFHVLGVLSVEEVAWLTRSGFEIPDNTRIPVASFDRHEAALRLGLPAMNLNFAFAAVLGHAGSAESSSALSRGDVDVTVYTLSRVRRLLQQGGFQVALLLSDKPHADFPGVPHLAGEGGLVDQNSAQLSNADRQQRLEQAALITRLSASVRMLLVSRNVNETTRQCLSEVVEQILGSESLAKAMDALGQEFSPIGPEEATRQIEMDAQLMNQHSSLLNSVLEQVLN